MIRHATLADAAQICAIYNHYVLETNVTFEEESLEVDTMSRRMQTVLTELPWLVCADEQGLLGYSYATRWQQRSAYRHSLEATVYLRPDAVGKGIGFQLYDALLSKLRTGSHHTVVGCIALPNEASIALHERLGFKKVGHFREVGRKFGTWLDVGYWQRHL